MAKKPEERYRSAGELANAALDALTAPEQHQAARILQHGEDAAAAETMARPAVGPAHGAPGLALAHPRHRSGRLRPPAFRPTGRHPRHPDFAAQQRPRARSKRKLVGA